MVQATAPERNRHPVHRRNAGPWVQRAQVQEQRTYWVNGDWNERHDPGGQLWVTLYQKAYLQAMGVTYTRPNGSYLRTDQWMDNKDGAYRQIDVALTALGHTPLRFSPGPALANPEIYALSILLKAGSIGVAASKDSVSDGRIVPDHT